jgi:hypothetical protein
MASRLPLEEVFLVRIQVPQPSVLSIGLLLIHFEHIPIARSVGQSTIIDTLAFPISTFPYLNLIFSRLPVA